MLSKHKETKGTVTIATTEVKDSRRFGLIISEKETNRVLKFIEKPKEDLGSTINAGLYVFNKRVFEHLKLEKSSVERETFPFLAERKEVYRFPMKGFWKDIGIPSEFKLGTYLYLQSLEQAKSDKLASGDNIVGAVLKEESSLIDESALVGPNVVLGKNVKVGPGNRLKNCILMDNTETGKNCFIDDSMVGWDSVLGNWSRVEANSLLGEGTVIKDELSVRGVITLPNVVLNTSVLEEGKVILYY